MSIDTLLPSHSYHMAVIAFIAKGCSSKSLVAFSCLISLLLLLLSLQSCPTLCDPIDGSPPGSPVPWVLQAKTLEWVAISFSNMWKWKVKMKLLSRVWLLAAPWTAAYQAPPSMGFSRQEYWSGVPLPSPAIWNISVFPLLQILTLWNITDQLL